MDNNEKAEFDVRELANKSLAHCDHIRGLMDSISHLMDHEVELTQTDFIPDIQERLKLEVHALMDILKDLIPAFKELGYSPAVLKDVTEQCANHHHWKRLLHEDTFSIFAPKEEPEPKGKKK